MFLTPSQLRQPPCCFMLGKAMLQMKAIEPSPPTSFQVDEKGWYVTDQPHSPHKLL